MNLDELQAIAGAATPGPWTTMEPPGKSYSDHGYRAVTKPWRNFDPLGVYALAANMRQPGKGCVWGSDAAHIAAFDPPTALRLIAIVRAAKQVDWLVSTHNSAELPPNIFDGFAALRQSLEGVKL